MNDEYKLQRFTQYYRYTGAALTSDLAWIVGAAFAPWSRSASPAASA